MQVRYGRILLRFWKNSMLRELSFRGHFVVNIITQLLWVAMTLVFIKVIYMRTSDIRGWSEHQYLFLLGTHMLVTGLFETFFFTNCWRVSELVRTGGMDFILLKPANTQFLLSLEQIDYSAMASLPIAVALCVYGVVEGGVQLTWGKTALFAGLIVIGVVLLYSLVFMFAVTSIWLIRQTGLNNLWFYVVSVARYPSEIYRSFLGGVLWFVLVFIVPILLVANLPANVMVRTFEPMQVAYLAIVSLIMLGLSSVVFNFAMKWYRSASS